MAPGPQPIESPGKTRDIIGQKLGVSGRSIDRATRVLKHATPEVIKAVEDGRMTVKMAEVIATEPEERQREELASPKPRSRPETESAPTGQAISLRCERNIGATRGRGEIAVKVNALHT